jgi:probable HAF family extracellular repeat protein
MRRRRLLALLVCAGVFIIVLLAVSLVRKPPARYRVTYLPSLGGFRAEPHTMNDHGQVVGVAEAPTAASYIFLWDKEQGLRNLGRFDDPPHIGGLYINNAGQIAGTVADPNNNQKAFLWDPIAGADVGPSRASGSSDELSRAEDPVASDARSPIPTPQAEGGSSLQSASYRLTLLGTLGGKQSTAEALNNRGQIAGHAEIPARYRHAFIWDAAAGMRDLGTLGGLYSVALSMNDAGQVLGVAETAERHCHMVLWEPIASPQDAAGTRALPDQPDGATTSVGPNTTAAGYRAIDLGEAGVSPFVGEINNRGLVVRRFGTLTGKTYFMTWTQATGSRTLDFVTVESGVPCGLNEANEFLIRAKPTGLRMFGRTFHRRHECYLWDPNAGPLLLETHLPVKDIVHFTVREMNNKGQIAAMLRTKDSDQIRAVLLEPTGAAR